MHFLARYWQLERGEEPAEDPLAAFFPFVGAPRFTAKEFLRSPRLWLAPLKDVEDFDVALLRD